MEPKMELLNLGDSVSREFEEFMRPLWPSNEEEGSFFHLISALSSAAFSNYFEVRKAYLKDNQVFAAWSCRNLLEIAIFAKFSLSSKQNAKEFADDRLIDGHQMSTLLRELELSVNRKLSVSAFEPVIQNFANQMKSEGITRTKFLPTDQLAKKVGMASEYKILNRICSKFVHPTSWSLFTSDEGPERFSDASEIFYVTGSLHLAEIFATIAPHVRKWGMHHKL